MSDPWAAPGLDTGRLVSWSIPRIACAGCCVATAVMAVLRGGWWWGISVATGALVVGRAQRGLIDDGIVGVSFVSRSRWTYVRGVTRMSDTHLRARGETRFRSVRLRHRGRFDMSEKKVAADASLATVLERVALGPHSRRVTWHVASASLRTVMCLPVDQVTPSGWEDDPDAWRDVVPWSGEDGHWAYETWRHLRTRDGVVVAFRVRDVGRRRTDTSLLAALAPFGTSRVATVTADVVPGRRAGAVAGRHVHRGRANAQVASLLGFRRRAESTDIARRVEQREHAVAEGHALLRVTLWVFVIQHHLRDLEDACAALLRDAQAASITLERGDGRHALWTCAAMPGAPS